MTNPKKEYKARSVLSDQEIQAMLDKADQIQNKYFRLRAKAIVSLLKKFGKRRNEIAKLTVQDLKRENRYLTITFTLSKKHKRGFFQYLGMICEKNRAAAEKTLYIDLNRQWKEWTKTNEGKISRDERADKKVAVRDKYTHYITDYLDYLVTKHPKAVYLFPSGKAIYANYTVFPDRHLSGRTILRIIKDLDPTAWCHLFREGKGAEIARDINDKLLAVFKVKDTLDLENEATAYRYIRRYAAEEMKVEET